MAKADKKDYQQMSQELAELMAWFESEQVELDLAVVKYGEAMALLGDMETYLTAAQNKVKKIAAKFE